MKLNKGAIALALVAGMAGPALADPIYIDVGKDYDGFLGTGDADTLTDVFDQFTFQAFDPVSTYYDTNSDGFVGTGDIVIDIGETSVGQLNPIGAGDSTELFGAAWGLDVSWSLIGFAGVGGGDTNGVIDGEAGETLGAQFFGGTVDFFYDSAGDAGSAIADGTKVLSVQVNNSAIDTTTGISLDLFGEVIDVLDNFLYFAAGNKDFHDYLTEVPPITITAFADAEIDAEVFPGTPGVGPVSPTLGLSNALFDAVFGPGSSLLYQTAWRTTTLDSPNANFSVPSPASVALLGLGLLGLRRFAKKRALLQG